MTAGGFDIEKLETLFKLHLIHLYLKVGKLMKTINSNNT